MILDTGFLISIERSEQSAHRFVAAANQSGTGLHTTQPVAAQAWRNGSRQARLAAFLKAITLHAFDDGRPIATSFPGFEALMNRLGGKIGAAS